MNEYNLGMSAFADDPYNVKMMKPLLQQAGLWKPEWDSWFNDQSSAAGDGAGTPVAMPDFSSLAGYASGNGDYGGGNRRADLVGPDGKLVADGAYFYDEPALFQGQDLLKAAAIVGGGALGMNALFGGLGAAGGATGAAGGLGEASTGLMGQYGGAGALGDASLLTGGSLGTVAQPVGGLSFGSMAGAGTAAADAGLKTLGTIPAGPGPVAPLSTMGPAATGAFPELLKAAGPAAAGLLSPTLLQLGGAALGALSSQDQEATKTQTNEPWAPAQPWIKSNIAAGQELQKKYTQQPFSQGQQAAYGNLYGLLNSYNKEILPGLLSNANAMSQGYDRFAPEKTRARPSFSPVGSTWNPGLLKFGG